MQAMLGGGVSMATPTPAQLVHLPPCITQGGVIHLVWHTIAAPDWTSAQYMHISVHNQGSMHAPWHKPRAWQVDYLVGSPHGSTTIHWLEGLVQLGGYHAHTAAPSPANGGGPLRTPLHVHDSHGFMHDAHLGQLHLLHRQLLWRH